MYYWSQQKIKELKSRGYKLRQMTLKEANREYDLTNKENYDKGLDNEKIQNNTKRHGNIRNRDNIVSRGTNTRTSRK